MGKFKEMLESVQGDFQKKIRQAKKGECSDIIKDIQNAFKDKKINQSEFDMLTAMAGRQMDKLQEEVQGINNTGIGYVITYSLFMVSQAHLWHLLCTSGQKHQALKELYEELQDEVDELAERFIAQGGMLQSVNEPLLAVYDDETVFKTLEQYRVMITSCIDSRPEMASIVDGIVDLQEVIDSKLYKFKMN